MNSETHEFGVRWQGAGVCGDVGWKRKPLTRAEAWEQVKETTKRDLVTFIEVVDFTLDRVVLALFRDDTGWSGGNPSKQ
jgi:hypothetical protein